GRLKTFPPKFSLVAEAVPESKAYVESVVNTLEADTAWNKKFIDILYSHFFSLEIPKVLAHIDNSTVHFEKIAENTNIAQDFICEIGKTEE
ncbi:MAG: hypothetical protein ACRC5Q_00685, partial [Culicoidibacterales bacterium]